MNASQAPTISGELRLGENRGKRGKCGATAEPTVDLDRWDVRKGPEGSEGGSEGVGCLAWFFFVWMPRGGVATDW